MFEIEIRDAGVASVHLLDFGRLEERVDAIDRMVVEEREPSLTARALVLKESHLEGVGAVEVREPSSVEVVEAHPENRIVKDDRAELEVGKPAREADSTFTSQTRWRL